MKKKAKKVVELITPALKAAGFAVVRGVAEKSFTLDNGTAITIQVGADKLKGLRTIPQVFQTLAEESYMSGLRNANAAAGLREVQLRNDGNAARAEVDRLKKQIKAAGAVMGIVCEREHEGGYD